MHELGPRRSLSALLVLFAAATLPTLVGCASDSMAPPTESPRHRISGAANVRYSSVELQATLLGFADTYIAVVGQSADRLVTKDSDATGRINAIRAKLDGSEAVVEIVSGPDSTVALLDLAVMVSLQRQVWDEYWRPQVFKDSGQEYSDAIQRLEREIWHVANRALTSEQVTDLHNLVTRIHKRYSQQVFVTSLRASQITTDLDESSGAVSASAGLMDLFGLSPAMEEVTNTRLLAERMFYVSQKLPTLISWRMDLQLATALSTPELARVLGNADEAVKNSSRFATLAEALPGTLDQQRQALLHESQDAISNEMGRFAVLLSNERTALFEQIAAERTALLHSLQEGQGDARTVLADLRTTIDAANQLTGSVNAVVGQIHELSKPGPNAPPQPPARPFDILEYQHTIESATVTIKELNTTLTSAKQLLGSPEWTQREQTFSALLSNAEHRARGLIILLCAGLTLSLLVGLGGAALIKRMVGAPAA